MWYKLVINLESRFITDILPSDANISYKRPSRFITLTYKCAMAVLLTSICVLIFMISKIPQGECSIKQAVFLINKQRYLAYHVIETKQAESELQCGMHCVRVRSCVSVNYKISGIGKGLCELNNKTLLEISDADGNMHNSEFNHLDIIKKVWEESLLLYTIITQYSCLSRDWLLHICFCLRPRWHGTGQISWDGAEIHYF
jgi:hypothetical protein